MASLQTQVEQQPLARLGGSGVSFLPQTDASIFDCDTQFTASSILSRTTEKTNGCPSSF